MALVRNAVAGFVLQACDLPGKPDIYFPRSRLAIFADGCFWHGCDECGHVPKRNTAFWALKIQRNRDRDLRTSQTLRAAGIRVLRLWEHELKKDMDACVAKIRRELARRSAPFAV
jgi:DNA mismatch endonuclease (patch repair protein)